MRYKDDWNEARRRLGALWRGERLDRPCISVQAPRPGADEPEPPADAEAFWLDVDYRLARARHALQTTWWGGEAVPSCFQQAGWVLCLGGTPHFSHETIWFKTRSVDFSRPSPFRHDPASHWTTRYHALYRAMAAEAGRDGFLVGGPGGLPANDLLSMLMGTQEFLTALVDEPDWMADALLAGARDQVRAREEAIGLVRGSHDHWWGNAGWMPFWAPEPFVAQQSDVSCMLSPAMFDRFVLPELDLWGAVHGALWYHLDGGDARQHLPRLLSLPYLRVLQYTAAPFEPPNGPAHLDFYKRVQAAGKIVHIQVAAADVEPLARELDPALLMLDTWCASPAEGERLLADSVRWAAKAPGAGTRRTV